MLHQSARETALEALGDATRRAIVDQLAGGPASVGDLAEPLGITTSAVLQHLKVLERSRLVASRKVGRVRMCELDPKGLEAASAWIDDRRALWEGKLDRLGELLADEGSLS